MDNRMTIGHTELKQSINGAGDDKYLRVSRKLASEILNPE